MANKKSYKPYTTEQKKGFGKKFPKAQREAYQKGKRMGFLEGVHKPKLAKIK